MIYEELEKFFASVGTGMKRVFVEDENGYNRLTTEANVEAQALGPAEMFGAGAKPDIYALSQAAGAPVTEAEVGGTMAGFGPGKAAGLVGAPGDIVALATGIYKAAFPDPEQGRLEAFITQVEEISNKFGSGATLGFLDDWATQSGISEEAKQGFLQGAEVGSFFGFGQGAKATGKGVVAAGKAVVEGAPARIAERGEGVTLGMGVDPTQMVDEAIVGVQKALQKPTKENPVTAVPPTDDKPGIIAFHGSGADFDEFSLEKIGTGEGAQAYGYGLYFTDNEDIAKFYRDAVGGKNINRIKQFDDIGQALKGKMTLTTDIVNNIIDKKIKVSSLPKEAQSSVKEILKRKEPPTTKKMYKVGLTPKPDELLDYDLPLSQQSEAVKEKAINVLKQIYPNVDNPALTMRGSDLIGQVETIIRVNTQEQLDIINIKLKELQKTMDADTPPGVTNIGTIRQFVSKKGEDAAKEYDSLVEQSKRLPIANFNKPASELLAQAGIPGIKYRAAGSRGVAIDEADVEKNYVIFDDKAIKILEKYGIVGPVAITALGAAKQEGEDNANST